MTWRERFQVGKKFGLSLAEFSLPLKTLVQDSVMSKVAQRSHRVHRKSP